MITQYSNFTFGTSPVSKLYQGDTLVWPIDNNPEGPGPDILLSWISNGSDAAQPNVYFDTQYIPDISTNVEIKYSFHSRIQNSGLFGSQDYEIDSSHDTPSQGEIATCYNMMIYGPVFTSSSKSYSSVINFNTVGRKLIGNSNTLRNGVSLGVISPDVPHTLVITQYENNISTSSKCTITNDTSIYRNNTSSASWVGYPSSSMYVFAINKSNNGPIYYSPSNTRVYYIKIYNQHTMYRFMIPVLHYDDSLGTYIPCFYDKVSNTYFYNQGTDNVKYQIQGDYVLDYIEQGDNEYLTFMTGTDVSLGILTNIGFIVSDSSTSMSTLSQNLVVGSAVNQGGPIEDPSTGYGLLFPSTSNTVTYRYVGLGRTITTSFDYPAFVRRKQHALNASMITYYKHRNNSTSYTKEYNSHFTVLTYNGGVLPNSSNIGYDSFINDHSYSSSLPTLGMEIGIFGDNNMHAQKTTKIFYVDIVNYELSPISSSDANNYIIKSCHSYVPALHGGVPCLYDYVTGKRIYNTGEGIPNYIEVGYPSDYTPPEPTPPPVIPDPPAGTYVLEPVDLGLSVKWATCNLGATTPIDDGYRYPWGDIEPNNGIGSNSFISNVDYKWSAIDPSKSSQPYITKYVYSCNRLDLVDDAAYVVNQNWRIPSYKEYKELKDNTVCTTEVVDNVRVLKFTSTVPGYTDKYIYFPAPITNNGLKYCAYWTNTLVEFYANYSYEFQRWRAAAFIIQYGYDYDIIYYNNYYPIWPNIHWAIGPERAGYNGFLPRTFCGFIRPVCP